MLHIIYKTCYCDIPRSTVNYCRVRTKVYYDAAMLSMYNQDESKVKRKLRSVMLYVEEMFHEKDTLTTIVQINAKTLQIERAPGGRNGGQNWSRRMR